MQKQISLHMFDNIAAKTFSYFLRIVVVVPTHLFQQMGLDKYYQSDNQVHVMIT